MWISCGKNCGLNILIFYFNGKFLSMRNQSLSALWVSVSLTGKVSNGCIRDMETMGFNPHVYQKLIGILVW